MHWLGCNYAVPWLNEAKTRIFQPTDHFENFKIYLYFVCLLPASRKDPVALGVGIDSIYGVVLQKFHIIKVTKWLLFWQPDALLQDYCSGTLCFALGSEPRPALPRPQELGAHNRLCHVF